MNAMGLVSGVAAGSALITATSDGMGGTANITVTAGLPVFPGAEGYGTTTPGGRGGQVIHVTNLNDNGPGSLRAALTAAGPRTVLFDVSGYITLSSDIQIGDLNVHTQDFLTVAGQTAPSPGITIRGGALIIRASDVLIQHLRIRAGIAGTTLRRDDIQIGPGPISRVVIDHVSVSWAGNGGKNFSTAGGTTDVTISNCIDSEAFPYGMLLSENDNRVSVLRCLFAHNFDRNPHVKSGGSTTFINNDIYNPGGIQNGVPRGAFSIWANVNPTSTNPNFCNIVGNTAKLGPTGSGLQLDFDQTLAAGSQCYLSDNAFANGFLFETGTGMVQVNSFPFTLPTPLTILASGAAEAYITAHAGARPSDRDPVDTRIINDVINLTGNSQLTNETQLGGFPALAQTTRVLAIPADYATLRPSGYTVLEEDILFPLATQVGGGP